MENTESMLQTKLSALAEAYDLDGIVALAQEVPADDVSLWRSEMMEFGFLAMYSYCYYDLACDRLGDWGVNMLDDIVGATEAFHGSPLRKMRAEVLSFRMNEVRDKDREQAKVFALRAIDELTHEISTDFSGLKFRAHLYHQLAQMDEHNSLHYWKLAVDDLMQSADFNLLILYYDWPQHIAGMHEAQQQAYEQFHQRMNNALVTNPDLIWKLLDEATRIWQDQPPPALDKQVTIWLQAALTWNGNNAEPMLLRNAGLILHKQGKSRQQPANFAKAIECFELFITKERAHAMEVYYMANVWEDWAALCEQQGADGSEYLQKAWDAYSNYEKVVRINFSPLLHYAEFLERLYFNNQLASRPSEEKVLALAVEAEVMGNGYYSGPGMIQARLAISRADTTTALYHLCRLLLRHELCIDQEIKKLRDSLTKQVPEAITVFLDEALKFMDEVSEGYYYDPKFTMDQLNELSKEATLNAWQERMVAIRRRRL
jgi:hypothetical protein